MAACIGPLTEREAPAAANQNEASLVGVFVDWLVGWLVSVATLDKISQPEPTRRMPFGLD